MDKNVFRADLPERIRRITFLMRTEMVFTVGQILPQSKIQITDIIRDENNATLFGKMMYQIFVKKVEEQRDGTYKQTNEDAFIWKTSEGVDCMVEYFF